MSPLPSIQGPSGGTAAATPATDASANLVARLAQALDGPTPPSIDILRTLRAQLFRTTQDRERSVAAIAQLGLIDHIPNIHAGWQIITHWIADHDVDLAILVRELEAHSGLMRSLPKLAPVTAPPQAINRYTAPPQDPAPSTANMQQQIWQELTSHWDQDNPPSLFVMKILQRILQNRTQDRIQTQIVASLLTPSTGAPLTTEAWATLKGWARGLGFTAETIGQLYLDSARGRKALETAAVPPAAPAPAAPVAAAATPTDELVAIRDTERDLMRHLRIAWMQPAIIPSAAVQRYLITLILKNHVVLTDTQAHAELGVMQQLLNSSDSKKIGEAWDQLKPWVKRRAFTDTQLHMRLNHLARLVPTQTPTPEDVRVLASPIHRQAYDVLMVLCEKASGATRYPSAMPQEWLDAGKASVVTVARARLNDWQIVDLVDQRFIVPPAKLLQYLLSPAHYQQLVTLGILAADGVPMTSSPTATFLDDLVTHLKQMLPRATTLVDNSGRIIHVASHLKHGNITNEVVLSAIAHGSTLLNIHNELYVIPATAIGTANTQIDGHLLLRLNTYGIIGLRGGPAAPWWPLRLKDEFKTADPFVALRESAAGVLDLPAFFARQRARWAGSTIAPAIALTDYPWVRSYPELNRWLGNHLSMIEPLDMKRIHAALTSAEQAHSVDSIAINMRMVQGILGEIVIRPKIVAAYHHALRNHPHAILAVAPQIFAGDVLEASDAMIFEMVHQGGAAALRLLSVWEVTTSENNISIQTRQLDHSLFQRYAQLGVHLRDNDGHGTSIPIDPLLEHTHMEARSIENATALLAAIEATTANVTTRFGQHEWTTNAHAEAVSRGTDRMAKALPHIEIAMSKAYTYDQFMAALEKADSTIAAIFKNMTRPTLGVRQFAITLAETLPLSNTSIHRWETLLESVCTTNQWPMVARLAKAAATSQGKERTRLAKPILDRAAKHQFTSPQALLAELTPVNPMLAAVLQNMTHPKDGQRLTQSEMAAHWHVAMPTIQSAEKTIAQLCAAQTPKWNISPMAGQAMSDAKKRARIVTALIDKAFSSEISLTNFRSLLATTDAVVTTIFTNMIAPAGGERQIPAALNRTSGISRATIDHWEAKLQALCEQRQWAIVTKKMAILDLLIARATAVGRAILDLGQGDVGKSSGTVSMSSITRVFGSFANALQQATARQAQQLTTSDTPPPPSANAAIESLRPVLSGSGISEAELLEFVRGTGDTTMAELIVEHLDRHNQRNVLERLRASGILRNHAAQAMDVFLSTHGKDHPRDHLNNHR